MKRRKQLFGGRLAGALTALAVCSLVSLAAVAARQNPPQKQAFVPSQAERVSALRMAIEDLARSFPDAYPGGQFLARLGALAPDDADGFAKLQRRALLANPLLDFGSILAVQRPDSAPNLGLPQNWQGNCVMPLDGFDDRIVRIELKQAASALAPVFKPEQPRFVGDVDLNFDGTRMLFSMPDARGRWQIWEVKTDGSGLRQVTPGTEPDVDNYDACYLPDGRIIFGSTRAFQGVPCVGGKCSVANLCIMDADGGNIRQLTFDQDHDWCPVVLNNGRVMYTRWEYSDTSHYFTRIMFTMNPDGTNQMSYYGSNSYWPNSMFYGRPIPNDPVKFAAIVSGHHGVTRMGELVLFDPAKGRFEADGALQRIPGHGKVVEPIIADQLVQNSWPKFLHPFPLSEKYFLVSCQPNEKAAWGIYLVDTFDNMLLLREEPGSVLFEPVPLRAVPAPPVVPDKVDLSTDEAVVYLADIYTGPGLEGVPRGTAKKLRVYEFHYGYPQMGGHAEVGIEGPWDVHRILGTVPVKEDGSALFRVPANTPIAIQPLDERGAAIQVMRSWFTAMPGETLSCVGCHEQQNTTPPLRRTLASQSVPSPIAPWRGPARGFSFVREVQPVLDKFCVGCHDGRPGKDGTVRLDLSRKDMDEKTSYGMYTSAYVALHPYVRRPGPESDYHLAAPYEWHASTSELVQMLEKGHHGVELDAEAWDRLYTWIDLNVPDKGTWSEDKSIPNDYRDRRMEMRALYAMRPEDPEAVPDAVQAEAPIAFVPPKQPAIQLAGLQSYAQPANWPLYAVAARQLQERSGARTRRTLDLGAGASIELVLIPAGTFVMGNADGAPDEQPRTAVTIAEPFWMSVTEVTNAQYQRFDPAHDNGFIDMRHKDHTTPGYPAQAPGMPVIRVSWEEAHAFCAWLGKKTGEPVRLPTEAQWEWASRAGADTPLSYGGLDADFSRFANLADASTTRLAVSGVNPQPIENPSPTQDYLPKDPRYNDGQMILGEVGLYQPNAWGLQDMHGNVAEWTASLYRAYPYADNDGRNDPGAGGERTARGGSWHDRPKRATSASRTGYQPYQKVYDVGFRIVLPARDQIAAR